MFLVSLQLDIPRNILATYWQREMWGGVLETDLGESAWFKFHHHQMFCLKYSLKKKKKNRRQTKRSQFHKASGFNKNVI